MEGQDGESSVGCQGCEENNIDYGCASKDDNAGSDGKASGSGGGGVAGEGSSVGEGGGGAGGGGTGKDSQGVKER